MGNAADLQWSAEDPVLSSPAATVDLTVPPVLSAAFAQRGLPLVPRLTLCSTDAVRGATLRLSVHDAAGPLATPAELFLDLPAGQTVELADLGPALDAATLLRVPERRPGWVRAELEAEGRLLAQLRVPVQVAGAAEWLPSPLPLALELLAAHVRPADPAITALLADAAELLEEGTGSGAIAGCSDDAERVDEVVEALTWAVRRRSITQLAPPAGAPDAGQRVRTPGEVLDGRSGTALDTVVTLAAACEQAGIRPLVWVLDDGHAFLGYWREERSAAAVSTTDVAALADLVDLGLVRLVETTLLTDRGHPGHDLHGPAYTAWLSGDLSRVRGVTDVALARREGVRPLPVPGPDADHLPAVEEVPPAEQPDDPAPPVPARVRRWLDRLLDLGASSPLLDAAARSAVPLTVPADAIAALEDLVASGATITLLPDDRVPGVHRDGEPPSARTLTPGQLAELLAERRSVHVGLPGTEFLPRMRALATQARTRVEETGANDLHLALGTLVWERDGRALRSPLLLVPVLLTAHARSGGFRLTLDETGSASLNWPLLEELRRRHGLTVTAPATPDEGGTDLAAAVHALHTALAARRLPWRVEPTAELAVVPFSDARVWQDLDRHWAEFATGPLVGALVADAAEPFADPVAAPAGAVDLDELAAQLPLPADAGQLDAVAAATAGRTFVLEGAPGTGKSQTIANLVVRAVAAGRRVLVVAGKRTALDVVARRLDAVGMGPFVLDLHDKGHRPAVVRAQIRAALEHTVEVDTEGLAADAADLDSARRGLARYAEQVHAANPAGFSAWSAHAATLDTGDDVPALPVTLEFAATADGDTVTEVHRALALLPDIADLARPSAHHAWGFLDTVELDITAVQQAAVAVDQAIRELPGEGGLAAAVRAARTPEDLDTLVHLLSGPPVGLDVLDEVRSPRWTAATDDVTAEVAALTAAVHPGFDVATPEALALPLADLCARAEGAADAGWWTRRGELAAVRDQLAPVLRPGAAVRTKDVAALVTALGRVQAAVHTIAARAVTIPGLQVPAGWNPFLDSGRSLLDAEVRWLRRAAAAVDGETGFAGALRRFLSAGPVTDAAAARTVGRLCRTVRHLLEVCSSSSPQLAAWCGEHGLVLRWTMTRPERGVEYVHPMSLRRWVSLLDTLEPLRRAGLTEARAQLRDGLIRAEDAVRAFDGGLAGAALAERRSATGLDAVDAGLQERTVARYAAASRAVRSHLAAAVPAAVLAARPFDASADDGGVAVLRRELADQRRGLGVRGLLSAHGDVVTTALPCVLAGPDAVARLLPATAATFDLVVIDEASRLRVADALGALGRARAAVVVGDGRQLPPAGGDGAEEPSVLSECLRVGVPRQELRWHYRSRDERLIAFSNRAWYGDRLSSFPAPPTATGRGISLLPAAGTFLRDSRTNPVEAQAVVAEVLRRTAVPAPPSIGVVTLHEPQRDLIETLLRDSGDERVREALDRVDGTGLLVRTVEHVQGDERDVVLLSLGAGAGRPADLGPLGRPDGERWLNVAITRARREVVVVTSLAAEQLPAVAGSLPALAALRGYLELAAGTVEAPAGPAGTVDRHREEVAAGLRERGLAVRTDVGLSDFRIDLTVAPAAAPETPVLAVLLDGPAWAARATVGDRDGLPVEVLAERQGWPAVERVWLSSWLADREAVLDELVAAVDAAVAATTPAPVLPAEPAAAVDVDQDPEPEYDGPLAQVIPLRPVAVQPEPEAEPEPEPEPEPQPQPAPEPAPVAQVRAEPATPEPQLEAELSFRPWSPRTVGEKKQLDQLADPAVAKVVRRVLAAGLKAEGPVHRDRLARLAAGAFGLTRVTASRRDALLALLPRTAVTDGEVVWPGGLDRDTWTSFRRQASSTERPLEHVPAEEIGNAMAALVRAAGGLTRDELCARTVEVFGSRRRTPAQQPLLEAALAAAVSRGRLTEHPDGTVSA